MRILRMLNLSLLAIGVCVALASPALAQTLRTLYRFTGGADGSNSYGGLIADAEGNLYGTTAWGGSSYCESGLGCGTVFKLDRAGKETVVYSFTGGTDGATPYAGLISDAEGNLYGTTAYGGSSNYGTVFRLDATGKQTVLHSFNGADGAGVYAGLIRDAERNLYGTTFSGGEFGMGTVFKLDAAGNETVLHSFKGADGENPYADLIRDAKGNLYGTTENGGASGYGTVFKLDAAGNETVLHSFNFADGGDPFGGRLIRDARGNLYGTTAQGGVSYNGTVFKLDPTGDLTVLYSFTGRRDGGILCAGLIRDAAGNLYSTTFGGGVPGGFGGYGKGTIFKIKITSGPK